MLTPSLFQEAMRNPAGIAVSTVDDTMRWLVEGSTLLFFVRDDRGTGLTPDEIRQVPVWVNMAGPARLNPGLGRPGYAVVSRE